MPRRRLQHGQALHLLHGEEGGVGDLPVDLEVETSSSPPMSVRTISRIRVRKAGMFSSRMVNPAARAWPP